MKQRKIVEAPVIDRNYLNDLYTSIHERIQMLDRLNEQYKTKQEEHFIQSFMNVVEKMGNDLILAQEAYRNIDIEVKRDEYCMELAAELQFFRTSCFQLKTALEKAEKSLTTLKIEKQNNDTEMASIRLNLEKKIIQNMQLKSENKELTKKISQLTKIKGNGTERQSYSVDGQYYRSFRETNADLQQESLVNDRRILSTQGGKRKIPNGNTQHLKEKDEHKTDSQTPHSDFFHRYDVSNMSNTQAVSFRKRSYQKSQNKISSDLFK